MKLNTIFGAGLVAAGALAVPAHADQLIVNGGFEDGVYSSMLGGNTNAAVPVDWTPNAGFDLNQGFNHVTSANPHSGSNALSISNFDNQPLATLSQTFADVAGATYSVSFWGFDGGANGDANAYLSVSVNGAGVQFNDTVSSYQQGTFTFVGTGSDTLVIAAQTNPSEWFVDDVSVTGSVSSVPESSNGVLLLAGMACIGATLRRQRARIG